MHEEQDKHINKKDEIKIIITGFRDKELLKLLEANSYDIQSSINKNTQYLIVKDEENKNDDSSKIDFAKKNNIPIVTIQEIKKIANI